MASPQVEEGYTRWANELLEAIYRFSFGDRRLRIMLYIGRMTYGFGRTMMPYKSSVMALDTGIDAGNCRTGLASLVRMNCALKQRGDSGYLIGIQKDYDLWKPASKQRTRVKTTRLAASKQRAVLSNKDNKEITTLVPQKRDDPEPKFDYQHAIDRYRAFAAKVGAPGCSDWSRWDEGRKRKFRAQVKKPDFNWEKILLAAYDSPFIRESIDDGKTWFKIGFLLQAKSWPILLEGGYGTGYAKKKQQQEEPTLVL